MVLPKGAKNALRLTEDGKLTAKSSRAAMFTDHNYAIEIAARLIAAHPNKIERTWVKPFYSAGSRRDWR